MGILIAAIAFAFGLGAWAEYAFDLSGRAGYAWRWFREWSKFRS